MNPLIALLVLADPHQVVTASSSIVDRDAFVLAELAPLGDVTPIRSDYVVGAEVTFSGLHRVRGVPCTERLWVAAGTWGCTLAEPWRSGGLSLDAGQHPSFRLANQHLNAVAIPAIVVAGVPCAGGFQLDDDGILASCTLAAPHAFPGTAEIPAGATVALGPNGHLVAAEFDGAPTLGGVSYDQGAPLECGRFIITFAPDGSVASAQDPGCGC